MKEKVYQRVYLNKKEIPLVYYQRPGAWQRKEIPLQRIISPDMLDFVHGTLRNQSLILLERKYNACNPWDPEERPLLFFRNKPYLEAELYRSFMLREISELSYGWPGLDVQKDCPEQQKIWEKLQRDLIVDGPLYQWLLHSWPQGEYGQRVLSGEEAEYFTAEPYPNKGTVHFDYGLSLGLPRSDGSFFEPASLEELQNTACLLFPYVLFDMKGNAYE